MLTIEQKHTESLQDIINILSDYAQQASNQNLYGEDRLLTNDDVDHTVVFSLFKDPDNMLKQFEARNKKFYPQNLEHNDFINNVHIFIGSPKIYQNYTVKQWAYIYNIPTLVVEILPWDNPHDDTLELGNHCEKGVLVSESSGVLDTVEHEIVHAVNLWLMIGGIFKTWPRNGFDTFNQELAFFKGRLERFRDESIAYLITMPGKFHTRSDDFKFRSLTGYNQKFMKSKLSDYHYQQLSQLITITSLVDKEKSKLGRYEYCRLLMKNADLQDIITEINAKLS